MKKVSPVLTALLICAPFVYAAAKTTPVPPAAATTPSEVTYTCNSTNAKGVSAPCNGTQSGTVVIMDKQQVLAAAPACVPGDASAPYSQHVILTPTDGIGADIATQFDFGESVPFESIQFDTTENGTASPMGITWQDTGCSQRDIDMVAITLSPVVYEMLEGKKGGHGKWKPKKQRKKNKKNKKPTPLPL